MFTNFSLSLSVSFHKCPWTVKFGVVLSDIIPQEAFLLPIPSLEWRDLILSLSTVRDNILVFLL